MDAQRRSFLAGVGLAGSALLPRAAVATHYAAGSAMANASRGQRLTWTIFSRHLQWLTTQDQAHADPHACGVLIGEQARKLGFDAIDLTVRPTGHVDPARADLRVNLPAMLRGIRSTGAVCDQITTNIELPDRPIARFAGRDITPEELLRVASDAGISRYRWGGFNYTGEPFGAAITTQLDAFAARTAGLARLNGRFRLTALYHTYSGGTAPRSVWDLMQIVRHYDPAQIAINFDIGHMAREGALSAWSTNLRYAMPHVRGVVLKDALVARTAEGRLVGTFPRAGTGFVQWQEFFALLKAGGYSGPAEAQFEYDLPGIKGSGVSLNTTFWADNKEFVTGNLDAALLSAEFARELGFYKQQASSAGWST